jgi:hypothetical protein
MPVFEEKVILGVPSYIVFIFSEAWNFSGF